MFRHFLFFKPAVVAVNLMCMPSDNTTNAIPSPPPPHTAVQQVARPAARTVSAPRIREQSPASAAPSCDCRGGLPSYTGGMTEEQMRAMD